MPVTNAHAKGTGVSADDGMMPAGIDIAQMRTLNAHRIGEALNP